MNNNYVPWFPPRSRLSVAEASLLFLLRPFDSGVFQLVAGLMMSCASHAKTWAKRSGGLRHSIMLRVRTACSLLVFTPLHVSHRPLFCSDCPRECSLSQLKSHLIYCSCDTRFRGKGSQPRRARKHSPSSSGLSRQLRSDIHSHPQNSSDSPVAVSGEMRAGASRSVVKGVISP